MEFITLRSSRQIHVHHIWQLTFTVGGWTELAESPAQKQWLHMQGLLQKNKNSTEKLRAILESSLSLNIKVNTEREEHAVKLDSPVASLVKKKATYLT